MPGARKSWTSCFCLCGLRNENRKPVPLARQTKLLPWQKIFPLSPGISEKKYAVTIISKNSCEFKPYTHSFTFVFRLSALLKKITMGSEIWNIYKQSHKANLWIVIIQSNTSIFRFRNF